MRTCGGLVPPGVVPPGVVPVPPAGVILVVMLVEQVSRVPPLFPVPLHWLTRTGIAGLTLEALATEQTALDPPPVTEPLHWVTVAPVVLAGLGSHSRATCPLKLPPPVPVPTHWLTVAAVTGRTPGEPALMLLVILTRHVTRGGAASLAEPLHWVTLVTRLVELVVKVPFPDGHGPSEHCRVTVVVEPLVPPLMVLTTVTVQVTPVVAPGGVAPMLLHWLTAMTAADAVGDGRTSPTKANAPASARSAVIAIRLPRG